MDREKRDRYIDRYAQAVEALFVAVDHIAAEELDVRPEPKAMSAREVIHHMADSELQEAMTLRRMLAENTPVLHKWDPQRYAERMHYERPVETALEMFRALALNSIDLMRSLTDEQWRRSANIQRPWTVTIEDWLVENVTKVHDLLMQVINAPHGGRVIPDEK